MAKWFEKDGSDWLEEDLDAARECLSRRWSEVAGRPDLKPLDYPANLSAPIVQELRRIEAGHKYVGARREQDFLDYVGLHVRSEIAWANSPTPLEPKRDVPKRGKKAASAAHRPSKRERALAKWMVDDETARVRLITMSRRRPGLTDADRLSVVGDFIIRNLRYVVSARDPERLLWPFMASSFHRFVRRTSVEPEVLPDRTDDDLPDIQDDGASPPDSFEDAQFADVGRWVRRWRNEHTQAHDGRLLRTCAECRRLVAFCLHYFDERSHDEIGRELDISEVHSRVLRNQGLQRLKHDLTRYPARFEHSSHGWIVVLNRPAYWPQTVDVTCSPAALGRPSASTVSIRTGETHAHQAIAVALVPFDTARPTDVLFDQPCPQGHTAVGEVRINQLRLEASSGGRRARTWIDMRPSKRSTGPLSLAVEPLDPCGTIAVGDTYAESRLVVDVPPVAHAVGIRVGILTRTPEPIAVTFVPARAIGGSKATVVVTPGVRVRVAGGGAEVEGFVCVVAEKSQRRRFTLTAAETAPVTVPDTVTVLGASAEGEVRTRPVASETSVEIVASGSDRRAAGHITLLPPLVADVTLPRKLGSGQSVEGVVKLSERAAEATTITFSIKNTAGLRLPDPVVVSAGKSQCSFRLHAAATALAGIGTVIATDGRSEARARIEIVANRIKSVTFAPATVVGGQPATGTIDFEFPVHADSDVDVISTVGIARFTSDGAAWDAKPVNVRVTVPRQGTTATFTIETARVARDQSVEFVADWISGRASGKLYIKRR